MARGLRMEEGVLNAVNRATNLNFRKSGLILSAKRPIFGASPDGICDDYVLEIKCPKRSENFKNVLYDNGELKSGLKGQLQLAMHLAGKSQGILCIAHPEFERSNNARDLEISYVDYDEHYVNRMARNATRFWAQYVFGYMFRKKYEDD